MLRDLSQVMLKDTVSFFPSHFTSPWQHYSLPVEIDSLGVSGLMGHVSMPAYPRMEGHEEPGCLFLNPQHLPVSVHQDCSNKMPWTKRLSITDGFLPVPEAATSKAQAPTKLGSEDVPCPGPWLLPSHWYFTWQKKLGVTLIPLYKSTNPISFCLYDLTNAQSLHHQMSSHRGLGFNVGLWERHSPSFYRTRSDEVLTDASRTSSPIKANLSSSPLVILKIKKTKKWKQSLIQIVFLLCSSFPCDFPPVSCIPKSSWWPWGFMWVREEQGSVSHLSITAFHVIWFVSKGRGHLKYRMLLVRSQRFL